MGFRFRPRFRIFPGVRVGVGPGGPSVVLGPRGLGYRVDSRGRHIETALPGLPIIFTAHTFEGSSGASSGLAGACACLRKGDEEEALRRLLKLPDDPGAAFLVGLIALRQQDFSRAIAYLRFAEENLEAMTVSFQELGSKPSMELLITPELTAPVGPDLRGILLALTESYQHVGRDAEAEACLRRLRQFDPRDIVVGISLAEFLLGSEELSGPREVVAMTEGLRAATHWHAALLLYRGRASTRLEKIDEALQAYGEGLTFSGEDEEPAVTLALRYERGRLNQERQEYDRARDDYEAIEAVFPGYLDVPQRLGLA